MAEQEFRVQLLLTGNEIMSGDTVDSNSALIARRLQELAVSVYRKVTVGDDIALLEQELASMAAQADLIIVNGGLGPTIDDLTAQIVASVAQVPLEEHPQAVAHLTSWCSKRNAPLNAANMKQAMLPAGATILANPVGSAVGFEVELNGCRIVCTPGVPSELTAMMDDIVDSLAEQLQRPSGVNIIRLQTFGIGESSAQQIIADNMPDWPEGVELGFRAGAPQMEVKLTISSASAEPAQQACKTRLLELLGHHVTDLDKVSAEIMELLREVHS